MNYEWLLNLNLAGGLGFIVVGFFKTLFGDPFDGWGFIFLGALLLANANAIGEARYD